MITLLRREIRPYAEFQFKPLNPSSQLQFIFIPTVLAQIFEVGIKHAVVSARII